MLSQSIREVIILPNGLNNASKSCWVIFFGNPETYKLAPLIASELGLAYETCKEENTKLAILIQETLTICTSSHALILTTTVLAAAHLLEKQSKQFLARLSGIT